MLTLKQVEDVCLYGSGAKECRFLAEDDTNGKFYCVKRIKALRSDIDIEVTEFIKQNKLRGIDPMQMSTPLGDNCSGYTFLKYKSQGYDLLP
jgi:hypothetical protein